VDGANAHSQVIVAHDVRDCMWVMARTPIAAPSDYDARLARMNALAYPVDKVRKVPRQ
jgi:apolipoprotein D and lipocalin family protein